MNDLLIVEIVLYVSIFLSLVLFLVVSTQGRYLCEVLFGLSKDKKKVYEQVKKAIEENRYEFKQLEWNQYADSAKLYYSILIQLPFGEISNSSSNSNNLSIKTENGQFESCKELNSAHLTLLIQKTGKSILNRKYQGLNADKNQRVQLAVQKIL